MPEISKRPSVPTFTGPEMDHIESVVFVSPILYPRPAAALIFGGTHPGAWLRTIQAHNESPFERIFVTGGHKRSGVPHHTWVHGNRPESEVIREHLIKAGIPSERIHLESDSENSKDNVIHIRNQLREHSVRSLALVFRSYGSGRQTRTLMRHLPEVEFAGCSYDTDVNEEPGVLFGSQNWRERLIWQSVVWGEYLRIVEYGRRDDLILDFRPLTLAQAP